nr:hypothetical protein [Tanacetum cinerariifolium]
MMVVAGVGRRWRPLECGSRGRGGGCGGGSDKKEEAMMAVGDEVRRQRQRVKQSGEIDIEFKIVDEYMGKVSASDEMMVVAGVGWRWRLLECGSQGRGGDSGGGSEMVMVHMSDKRRWWQFVIKGGGGWSETGRSGRQNCLEWGDAQMSMGRVFKTHLRRRRVKQSGEIDIEFKIVDEYTGKVNKIEGRGKGDAMMVVAGVGWRWRLLECGSQGRGGGCGGGLEMVMVWRFRDGGGAAVVATRRGGRRRWSQLVMKGDDGWPKSGRSGTIIV